MKALTLWPTLGDGAGLWSVIDESASISSLCFRPSDFRYRVVSIQRASKSWVGWRQIIMASVKMGGCSEFLRIWNRRVIS